MTRRRFPVLWPYRASEIAELEALGCPWSVAWDLVAPHATQAKRNHYQTLERLAERGGLSPKELLAVLTDRSYEAVPEASAAAVVSTLREIIGGPSQ